jgi:hypothetical protein
MIPTIRSSTSILRRNASSRRLRSTQPSSPYPILPAEELTRLIHRTHPESVSAVAALLLTVSGITVATIGITVLSDYCEISPKDDVLKPVSTDDDTIVDDGTLTFWMKQLCGNRRHLNSDLSLPHVSISQCESELDDDHVFPTGHTETDRFFHALDYHRQLLPDYIHRWDDQESHQLSSTSATPNDEVVFDTLTWPRNVPQAYEIPALELDLQFCKRSPTYRQKPTNACHNAQFRLAAFYLINSENDPVKQRKGFDLVKELAEWGHPDGMCLFGALSSFCALFRLSYVPVYVPYVVHSLVYSFCILSRRYCFERGLGERY